MQRKPNFKFCAADLETFLILPLQFTERGIHTNPEPPLVQDNDFHEKNCRNSITVFSILQCKKKVELKKSLLLFPCSQVIVIFYTEILTGKVVLWCFFSSETSEKIHNSTFQVKISV